MTTDDMVVDASLDWGATRALELASRRRVGQGVDEGAWVKEVLIVTVFHENASRSNI